MKEIKNKNYFTAREISFLENLKTPTKIQDFLNTFKFNFEEKRETLQSPLMVLHSGKMHCLEGALLGAYILSLHGYKPLIMHLEATKNDFDHVVTLFQEDGFWGALSKTNHAVLRYREPIYKNIRELVMSYFHEYFLKNGQKTLRKYSAPLNLNIFDKTWITDQKDLWYIDKKLDQIKHYDIASKTVFDKLRKADAIEIKAGEIVEYKKKK